MPTWRVRDRVSYRALRPKSNMPDFSFDRASNQKLGLCAMAGIFRKISWVD